MEYLVQARLNYYSSYLLLLLLLLSFADGFRMMISLMKLINSHVDLFVQQCIACHRTQPELIHLFLIIIFS